MSLEDDYATTHPMPPVGPVPKSPEELELELEAAKARIEYLEQQVGV